MTDNINDTRKRSLLFTEISRKDLLAIIQQTFGYSLAIESFRPLSGGDFNTTYKVDLNAPPGSVILRAAPPPDKHHSLFSFELSLMEREREIISRVRDAGVRAPRVFNWTGPENILGRSIMISEFVAGESLSSQRLTKQQKNTLRQELKAEILKIRSIKNSQFGWAGQNDKRFDQWYLFLLSLLSEIAQRNQENKIIPEWCVNLLESAVTDNQEIFEECQTPTLLHNDFHARNILIDDAFTLSAIIDFDRAIFGDPEFEMGTSPLVNNILRSESTAVSSPSVMFRRRVYNLIWDMIDADMCRSQHGNFNTSDVLVDCVKKNAMALKFP